MGGRFNTHNNQFYIIVVYRFHYKDNEFSTEFNEVLKDYKNKPLIVIGDFNINLLNYDSNKTVDDFVNDMFSNSFYPSYSILIDQAWSNMLQENTNCSILNVSVSTHKPLLITMPVSLKHYTENDEQTKNMRIHNITETTIEKFSGEFNEFMDSVKHYLNNITDKDCLRNVFSNFYSNLSDIYNSNIIVNKSFASRRNIYDKPWMSTFMVYQGLFILSARINH